MSSDRNDHEAVASITAQMEEMKCRHKAEVQSLEKLNRELLLQLGTSATASVDANAEMESAELSLARSHIDSLTRRLDELLRHKKEMEDAHTERVADEWASMATQNLFLEMECDHRRDKRSLKRSKLEKVLREKTETIDSLRDTLAQRERKIESLTSDLKETKNLLQRKEAELQALRKQVELVAPRESTIVLQHLQTKPQSKQEAKGVEYCVGAGTLHPRRCSRRNSTAAKTA
eukprot:CAMPEP_0197447026 /NCGR_PEP_ID=MMETSP1175-20131217/11780_1 /TAXON_ID=1003142 /ORGANISM="Triceratium dubium, Strain CCMP147" /LENGTH=232 /DNA_ID=CAMNT_0042978207 /DNA_START=177 /DNA_END=875 /DNA_ORIENTATION=-